METVSTHTVYLFGGFRLESLNWQLFNSQGENIKLSLRSSDVLAELVKHKGTIVSKDHLMNTIWFDVIVEDNNIVQAISSIRKALSDTKAQSKFIQTVPGRGYCFIADVKIEEDAAPAVLPSLLPRFDFIKNIFVQHKIKGSALFTLIVALVFIKYFPAQSDNTDAFSSLTPTMVVSNISDVQAADIIPDSIVVMPLSIFGSEPENNLYAIAFLNELKNQLIKLKSLKVITHNSTNNIFEGEEPVSEISRLLKVETVMTGSVSFFEDGVAHISLQAIEGVSGLVLWAESYDVKTDNSSELFTIQRQIAMDVADALAADVEAWTERPITKLKTHSFDAYRYYSAAKQILDHRETEQKWKLTKKALDLDPDYADALLLFASTNSTLITNPLRGYTSDEHLQLMVSSLDRYLGLRPEGTRGYALKAVALGVKQDWEGVHQQIKILKELEAGLSDMKYVALLMMCLGDFHSAIDIYERSLITEPVNLYSRGFMMAAYEMSGNAHVADKEYAFGNELSDRWWGDNVNILLALGRNQTVTNASDLLDISPNLIDLLNNQNDHEAIKKGVSDFLSSQDFSSAEGVFYGALAAYSGDIQDALSVLRQIIDNASTSVSWVWLPVFNEVRKTNEFKQILEDVGLISYWRKYGWPEICQPLDDSFTCS